MSLLDNIEELDELTLFKDSFFKNGKEGIEDFIKYLENNYDEIEFTKRYNFIVVNPIHEYTMLGATNKLCGARIVICIFGKPRLLITLQRMIRWGSVPPGESREKYFVYIEAPYDRPLINILGSANYKSPDNRYFRISRAETEYLITSLNKIRVDEYFKRIRM